MKEAELRRLLELVPRFPDGKFPEFAPAESGVSGRALSSADAIATWRKEFRDALEPEQMAATWQQTPELKQLARRERIDLTTLASSLFRTSTAVSANALSEKLDLEKTGRQVDKQIEVISREIDRLDTAIRQSPTATPRGLPRQREISCQVLREAVALSEFLKLLIEVPAESKQVVRKYQSKLKPLLPQSADTALFERVLESRAVLRPVSHEVPKAGRSGEKSKNESRYPQR